MTSSALVVCSMVMEDGTGKVGEDGTGKGEGLPKH